MTLPPLSDATNRILYPYQKKACQQLVRAITNGHEEWGYNGAADLSDVGCHAYGQKILMHDGSLKEVQEIRVGDVVQGWRGPQVVTCLLGGRGKMVRVIPVKGEPFTVNEDHILTLVYTNASHKSGMGKYSGRIIDISVRAFQLLPTTHQSHLKLFRRPVGSWPTKEVPIDPYFLGVYLGDGSSRHSGNTVSITTEDIELEKTARSAAEAWSATSFKKVSKNNNSCHSYMLYGVTKLRSALESLGLWGKASGDKFIPEAYRTGSVVQRLEVLAGLMDTDGSRSQGGHDFITKSERLAEDVTFIARSLGMAANKKASIKKCQTGASGTYWRVFLGGGPASPPCRLKRKQLSERRQKKSVLVTGFRLEERPEDSFYGFSLAGDGRFLLGDFTVTHNTGKSFIDYGAALETGREPIVLTPLAGFTGWQQTFTAFNHHPRYVGTPDGLKQGNRTQIATRHGDEFRWHGAANSILILDEAQAFKGMDSVASRLIDGAMAQHIPIICASATLATSPLELRIAGAVTGLHTGTPPDWERFIVRNGCRWVDEETGWVWNRKVHYLEQIHHTLIPMRGCRVRKSDMGERPGSTIQVLPIECEEGPQIQREWSSALDQLSRMAKQGYPKMVVINTRRKIRMRLWRLSEQALVPHVARLMKEDLEQGKSVIGFFTFTETREQMGRLLGTRDGFYGGQPTDMRARLAKDFQANRIRVLLNQIKAGGSSVSLHDLDGGHPRVSYIFPSDSGVAMQQAPGRTDRAGMQSHAQVWIPCVAGSLSEKLVHSTSRKLLAMAGLNDGAAS